MNEEKVTTQLMQYCPESYNQQNGVKYFYAMDVAKYIGVKTRTFNRWLQMNTWFTENEEYVFIPNRNTTRPKRYISPKGVITYINCKDSDRGNDKKRKPGFSNSKKEKIAEIAYEKKTNFSHATDPIIAMRMEQLEMQERQQRIESIIDKTEKRIEKIEEHFNEDNYITAGQRTKLNELIRRFCYDNPALEVGRDAAMLWRKMHEHTGRRTIESYTQEDYKVAIKWLRQLYSMYNMQF